jgi:hypothetical protein
VLKALTTCPVHPAFPPAFLQLLAAHALRGQTQALLWPVLITLA